MNGLCRSEWSQAPINNQPPNFSARRHPHLRYSAGICPIPALVLQHPEQQDPQHREAIRQGRRVRLSSSASSTICWKIPRSWLPACSNGQPTVRVSYVRIPMSLRGRLIVGMRHSLDLTHCFLGRLFLSKYFKHANWHSFVRQLNMYGFNKQVNDVFQTLSQPADQPVAWEFRHSIFRRGDPTCVQRIKRRSVKSNSTAHRDLASSQIARPAGLPTATPITPVVYQSPYQPVSYASDAASHSVMALPRYSGGDPYAMSGGYPSVVGGSSASAPSHGWMSNPNSQYV